MLVFSSCVYPRYVYLFCCFFVSRALLISLGVVTQGLICPSYAFIVCCAFVFFVNSCCYCTFVSPIPVSTWSHQTGVVVLPYPVRRARELGRPIVPLRVRQPSGLGTVGDEGCRNLQPPVLGDQARGARFLGRCRLTEGCEVDGGAVWQGK